MKPLIFALRARGPIAACLLFTITGTSIAQPAVPPGFEVDTFAVVSKPNALAFALSGSSYGPDLYVANNRPLSSSPDSVYRVSASGTVTPFAALVPGADPQDLVFPPPGSPYGDYLYLSANNRDFGQPFDCGGTIQRLDTLGNFIDFTSLAGCASCFGGGAGLGEPVGLAFGPGGGFGNGLYVGNSSDVPGDICHVSTGGGITTFVDDTFCSPDGMAPLGLAFSSGGAFGNGLYFTDFGDACDCVRIADTLGSVSAPFATFATTPFAIAFGFGPAFGGDLFVTAGDTLFQVASNGTMTPFASDFGPGHLNFVFSPDGNELYVSEHGAGVIYRIRAVSVSVPGRNAGDSVRLLPSTPNPFGESTTLRFELGAGVAFEAGATRATVRIYTAAGRLVRDLSSIDPRRSVPRSVLWDGRDVRGRRLPAGVYFYRVEADRGAATGKVTLVR